MLASTLLARTGRRWPASASVGGAGVLLMFGIGAGLVSIIRRDADAPPDAVSDVANGATSPMPAAVRTPGR
jgi:hypothetical protein